MISSSGKSCHRMGFENVAEGGQGPLTPPAVPVPLVPAPPTPLIAPAEPAALTTEPAAPADPVSLPEPVPPAGATLPAEPANVPVALPALLAEGPSAPPVGAPAALVRPPSLAVCGEAPLPQAPLANRLENTARRVRAFTRNTDPAVANAYPIRRQKQPCSYAAASVRSR